MKFEDTASLHETVREHFLGKPAPAGDDAIGLANIAKFCWEDAEAEIRELTEALGVSRQMSDEDWLIIAKLRYDCAEWKRRAQASNIVTREEVAFTSDFRMAFGQTTDHPTGTGYRKLAPAQSVGQSAAQGVGMEEIAKWCEAEAANSDAEASRLLGDGLAMAGNVHLGRAVAFEITAAHIRRLSALPKGQDDE